MLETKEEQATFGFYDLPQGMLAQLEAAAPVPADDESEGPLSPAARQRRHRQKLKQQREAEGLKTLNLTLDERMWLAQAAMTREAVRELEQGACDYTAQMTDALLRKLCPEQPEKWVNAAERIQRRAVLGVRGRLERAEASLQRVNEMRQAFFDEQDMLKAQLREQVTEAAKLRAEVEKNRDEYALTLKERGAAWDDNARLRAENETLQRANARLQAQLAEMAAELTDILQKSA